MLHKIIVEKPSSIWSVRLEKKKTCSTVVGYISLKNNFQYVLVLETFIQGTLSEFKAFFVAFLLRLSN